jgi:hypothetical protein
MARKIKTIIVRKIWGDTQWTVRFGKVDSGPSYYQQTVANLFKVVGEKLPFDALSAVDKRLKAIGVRARGVYLAHDSMGYVRYIGRGKIFPRLRASFKRQTLELKYFSFYVVEEKKHEGEIETLLIRAAGPLLQFNTQKKKVTIKTGGLLDYEAGTHFFERRYERGKSS